MSEARAANPRRAALGPADEGDLVRLLDRHFGDGSVYLDGEHENAQLERAVGLGLVSADGMLTVEGWRFWRCRVR